LKLRTRRKWWDVRRALVLVLMLYEVYEWEVLPTRLRAGRMKINKGEGKRRRTETTNQTATASAEFPWQLEILRRRRRLTQ
jgi:hypothetical protein